MFRLGSDEAAAKELTHLSIVEKGLGFDVFVGFVGADKHIVRNGLKHSYELLLLKHDHLALHE